MQATNDIVMIRPILEEKKPQEIASIKVRIDSLMKGVVESVGGACEVDLQVGDVVLYTTYYSEEYDGLVFVPGKHIYGTVRTSE